MSISISPGDVVVLEFPGAKEVKRRPAVVISSQVYHASRPDVVVGLVTSRDAELGPTDCVLRDWSQAGLRTPSVFRSFFATLPTATHHAVVGHLTKRDWQQVCGCVRIALDPLASVD